MWNKIEQKISRALSSIRQAFRGKLTNVVSTERVQLIQGNGLAGEKLQDNELFQHYGFTSNPPVGSMFVVLPLGGKTSHGIVIATEHGDYRLQGLKSGEVALYTDEGANIVIKRGRVIEADCDVFRVNCKTYEVNASSKTDFNTPMLTASAEVTAKSKITGQGGMSVSGGSGAEVSGNMKITGGDVSADNVTLKTLKVTNVQPGSGTSGVPVQ